MGGVGEDPESFLWARASLPPLTVYKSEPGELHGAARISMGRGCRACHGNFEDVHEGFRVQGKRGNISSMIAYNLPRLRRCRPQTVRDRVSPEVQMRRKFRIW